MATLRLNDEQKKLLKRYNALLKAVADEGVFWTAWYSQGDTDFADGPYPQGDGWYARKDEVEPESEPAKFLTQIVNDYISSISGDIDSYAYDDDTTGSGDVIFEYNPQTMTFNIDIRYYVRQGEDSKIEKSFSEVSQDQPAWAFGDQSGRPYKKLNDDEFVQSIIDKNNGRTDFEFSYYGFGLGITPSGGNAELGRTIALLVALSVALVISLGSNESVDPGANGSGDGEFIVFLWQALAILFHDFANRNPANDRRGNH